MDQSPQPITTFNIGIIAYQTFTALRSPVWKLIAFGLFLPSLIEELLLSKVSQPAVFQVKVLAEQLLSSETPNLYKPFEEATLQFLSPRLGIMLVFLIIYSATYMALIKLASTYHLREKPVTPLSSFIWGARAFIPKGYLFFMVFFFLSLEQFMWGPFKILSMLVLMTPVLYTLEAPKLGTAINRSLFLKYINPQTSSGFNTALTLIIFGAFLYFGEAFIVWGESLLLSLDEILEVSREFWNYSFFNFPFTWNFLFVNILKNFAESILLASLAFFTVALYFRVSLKPIS